MSPLHLDRYIATIVSHRWLVAALAVLVMVVMTAGVRFISVTNDYRIMLGEDNPQLAAFDALENTYSVSNKALIAVASGGLGVHSRGAWGD